MSKINEKICPGCKQILNIKEQNYVYRKSRYWHEDCLKTKYPQEDYTLICPTSEVPSRECKKQAEKTKSSMKKCYYCGEYFDIETEEWAKPVTNRYAHKSCYKENYNEDQKYVNEIYSYLSSLLIKYDFQTCERQRLKFIQKNGYTNEGILLALKYFYEVKKQSPDRSGNRIGIVPYVYDEAKAYYEELYKQKNKITKNARKQFEKEKKIITLKEDCNTTVSKNYIDIDKLGE